MVLAWSQLIKTFKHLQGQGYQLSLDNQGLRDILAETLQLSNNPPRAKGAKHIGCSGTKFPVYTFKPGLAMCSEGRQLGLQDLINLIFQQAGICVSWCQTGRPEAPSSCFSGTSPCLEPASSLSRCRAQLPGPFPAKNHYLGGEYHGLAIGMDVK